MPIRGHARGGPGEFRELAHFEKAVRGEGRDRDAADFLEREIEVDELDDVRQLHDHPIERREAGLEQVQCQAVGDIVDFAIRDARVAIDEGDAFGVALEYRRELFGERPVPPVALVAVASREFGRKGDDSFQQAALLDKPAILPDFRLEISMEAI